MSVIEVGIHPKLEGRARVTHHYGDTHIIYFLPHNYTSKEEEKVKRWVVEVAAICEMGPDFFHKNYSHKLEKK
jgi:Tat protein secretion system quality control protein TatD with DNase activity